MPQVSIIVTSFNKWELTWHTIDSLYRTCERSEVELILVDNGSHDRTVDLYPYFDFVIQNEIPANLARSLNLGVDAATSSIVSFFNNDLCVVTHNWLEPLLVAHREAEEAAVMPLLIEGVAPSNELFNLLKLVGEANQARVVYTAPVSTHLEMACTFFPRTILERVGRFDEGLPLWYHHQDYFVRMRSLGVPILRLLNCIVRHLGNVTIGYSRDSKRDDVLRQEYAVFRDRYSPNYLAKMGLVMPPFGPYDLVPATETVLYTEQLSASRVLSLFGIRHD